MACTTLPDCGRGQGSWLHVRRIRAAGMAQSHSARESGRIVSLRGRSVPDVGGTGRGRNRTGWSGAAGRIGRGGIPGTFAVIWLCIAVGSCRMLAYIGRYSLVYYALNALTLNLVKIGLFRVIGIDVASTPWFSQLLAGLAATALALVILTIANLFVQRWMWWAIGKKRP